MSESIAQVHEHATEHEEIYSKTILGFWIYIMTDCILFATLFATYAVLYTSTFGGPSAHDLFDLPFALGETFILLASSFTCGLAMISAYNGAKKHLIFWTILTFIFGASFVGLELTEFSGFVREGNSWQRSAFLSSFFTLVGTHGFHVSVGLLWMVILTVQILKKGLTFDTFRRFKCFSMFWHFLDVVWIFIFTFVYLMGVK